MNHAAKTTVKYVVKDADDLTDMQKRFNEFLNWCEFADERTGSFKEPVPVIVTKKNDALCVNVNQACSLIFSDLSAVFMEKVAHDRVTFTLKKNNNHVEVVFQKD